MSNLQPTLFDTARMQMTDSIRQTAENLNARVDSHPHWVFAWSGGKDSTTVLTVSLELIRRGIVRAPKSISVLYADTRLELLPLVACAAEIRAELAERGIPCETVMAPMDKRFLVYMLGRGVPPPNNGSLRWCTRQIKIDPMAAAIKRLAASKEEPILLLTGVRIGESAARDARIAVSCSKDGGECGQGRFQHDLSGLYDTLDPILHWRICHVWEWLCGWAPRPEWGEWDTAVLAQAYGGRDGDEAAESEARTGCNGCPLATKDAALDGVLRIPRWQYLAPIKELRPLWRELRKAHHRIRKDGTETKQDGTPSANPGRMGPLKLDTRLWALDRVLDIQRRCNEARGPGPAVDMLDATEEARIRELIAAGQWPDGWRGDEISGDEWCETDAAGNGILFRPGEFVRGAE